MGEMHESALTVPDILAMHYDLATECNRYSLPYTDVIDDQKCHSVAANQNESLVLISPVGVAQRSFDFA
jgi:hypothetical protein